MFTVLQQVNHTELVDFDMTTPKAPRARNTSDINENDAKLLTAAIASFASLELTMQMQQQQQQP